MIISGGSRKNWRFFSKHLTNGKDNDRATLIEVKGLAAENVLEAFREMDEFARWGTCDNFFYHANINPREGEHLTPAQWDQAVDTLETKLGLAGQSRFVVEHEKDGRVHRHVIWSRMDADTLTAISDSHNYAKHQEAARELETAFGHEPVQSTLTRDGKDKTQDRNPENWEVFRGKKSGVDPKEMKAEITALWQTSDSGPAFQAALQERGYLLCKGDRRDFCLIDPAGEEHSLAKRIKGVKAAEIRERLGSLDRDSLPSVGEARTKHAAWREAAESEGHARVRKNKVEEAAKKADKTRRKRDKAGALPDGSKLGSQDATQNAAPEQTEAERLRHDQVQSAGLWAARSAQVAQQGITWPKRLRGFFDQAREQAGKVKGYWRNYLDSRKDAQKKRDQETGWRSHLSQKREGPEPER